MKELIQYTLHKLAKSFIRKGDKNIECGGYKKEELHPDCTRES